MTQNTPPLRLGIIGAGIAVRTLHTPALKRLRREFDVVAVCSQHPQRARAAARPFPHAEVERDIDALLSRDDIDAVDVVTPIPMNAPVAARALEAGKHVLVEKPAATSLEEARLLGRAARKAGRVLMVGENWRYRQALRLARQWMEEGSIGKVRFMQWLMLQGLDRKNVYVRTAWRARNRYPGGFLFDGGVHIVAGMRVMFGEIASVEAAVASSDRSLGTLDSMQMRLNFRSGVKGVYTTGLAVTGVSEDILTVFGARGILTLRGDDLQVSRGGRIRRAKHVKDAGGFYDEFRDFYQAVTGGAAPRSSLEEGTRDIGVLLAAFRSSREGRPVNLSAR